MVFFGNVCCCCCKHGRSLIYRERGDAAAERQQWVKSQDHALCSTVGITFSTTKVKVLLPLPCQGGPWQGNNYNYNKKRQNKFAVSFVRDIEKVYLLLLLSVSLSVCPLVLLFRIHSIISSCFSVCCYSCCCCCCFDLCKILTIERTGEKTSRQNSRTIERGREGERDGVGESRLG